MTAIGTSLIMTLIWVTVPGLITTVASRRAGEALGAVAGTSVVLFVLNAIGFWLFMPAVGLTAASFWYSGIWLAIESIITVIIVAFFSTDEGDEVNVGAFIGAIVAILALVVPLLSGVYSDGRAKTLAHEISTTSAKFGDYPATDADHIVLLSPDMATFKAQQAMNQATAIGVAGTSGNVSTYYELGDPTLESVNNHAYYLLAMHPSGYRNNTAVSGLVPGYMQVDAENPDLPAKLVTTDASGQKLSIAYYPGGYYSHNLTRHVWNTYHGHVTNDPTLEVDDQGKPYFTLSLDRLTLNNEPTVPQNLLVVDAQSGVITSYPLNKIPDWVDRVYSAGTVETMLDWWGQWNAAPYNAVSQSSANRYKIPDDEDPQIVYTKGGHPKYQVIMTSYNKDTAAAYLVLADARDNQAEAYQIPGLTLESVATKTITGSSQNIKHLTPTHMGLHRIYGELTWVSPLQSGDNAAYQGLALVRATDVNGSSVVISTNKADALSRYREVLAQGSGSNASPEENSNVKTLTGAINSVSSPLTEGQNGQVTPAFYFTLAGDPAHVYHVAVSDQNPELPFIKDGLKVRITYFDTGAQRRDVGSYDDLSRSLSSK